MPNDLTFEAYLLRFHFRALDRLSFPPGKSGNTLRGAFGLIFRKIACRPECIDAAHCDIRSTCAYARIFEPAAVDGTGPSGLADWPRPFVFRASHLDGRSVRPGEEFHFDLNLFAVREPVIDYFVRAFARLAEDGIGAGRGRADLLQVTTRPDDALVFEGTKPVSLPLAGRAAKVRSIEVEFLTPTELKGGERGGLVSQPEFGVLLQRARDRIATLRSLYGAGPIAIDFRGMGKKAAGVRMLRCDVQHVVRERLSSRTGQRHPLGGFVGRAEYEGDGLEEFLPWLEAASVTGVGRHTTWGKGELRVRAMP